MAGSAHSPRERKKAVDLSERLYGLLLRAYPAAFRRAYGLRMARVFRDACQDMLYQRGLTGLGLFWLHILSDLLLNASLER